MSNKSILDLSVAKIFSSNTMGNRFWQTVGGRHVNEPQHAKGVLRPIRSAVTSEFSAQILQIARVRGTDRQRQRSLTQVLRVCMCLLVWSSAAVLKPWYNNADQHFTFSFRSSSHMKFFKWQALNRVPRTSKTKHFSKKIWFQVYFPGEWMSVVDVLLMCNQ